MKLIEVIIPTRNRLEKLKRCLFSIPRRSGSVQIRTVVICDGDPNTAEYLTRTETCDRVISNLEHRGSVYCRNLATQACEDALIYAVDDMWFLPDAFLFAIEAMRSHFPDEDGVIGFAREDRDHSKIVPKSGMYAGVALVGQKFLRRFPNRKLFYPGYFFFAAQELTNFAYTVGKIEMAPEARIFHHAPRKGGGLDQTHYDSRLKRHEDRDARHIRREKKVMWGDGTEGLDL